MPDATDPAWSMERAKRRLDTVPALLGAGGDIGLCGLPVRGDVAGALRVEGLLALLAATGREARAAETMPRDAPRIWLGGATPALAAAGATAPVLLWPPPEAPVPLPAEVAALARPHWIRCHCLPLAPGGAPAEGLRRLLLPDPAHALWGLLDQHPRAPAGARLDLLGEAPPVLLAPAAGSRWKRVAHAAIGGLPAPHAARLGRRWGIERARRALLAAESIATDRIGHGILAALLGRRVAPHAAAVRDYWAAWAPAVLEPAA